MPTYTVTEVLDIIQDLSLEQQSQLKQQLPKIWKTPSASDLPGHQQSQLLSVGGSITVGGTDNTMDMSQVQAGRNVAKINKPLPTSLEGDRHAELLAALATLKQAIQNHTTLTPLEKATANVPLQAVEEELQKPQPNPGFVEQAIATLKKGLAGVETLAAPTARVADLMAKAWIL